MMDRTAIIIGGGMGGLFTGALLAKNGCRVTVLEKNRTAGGGLQTFVRDGEQFDTGMHIVGGFGENGSLRKICGYLGILDRLSVRDCDSDCADSLTYLSTGETYRMGNGRERFVENLCSAFPEEKAGILAYVDALYAMADGFNLYNLRPEESLMPTLPDDALTPADEFIARYAGSPKLRDVLAYMNPMYGGVAGHTPAYVHALLNVLFINGRSRFEGSSQQLADALVHVIESFGGRVETGTEVVRISVEDRKVTFVETASGQHFQADYCISAVHPCELLRLTGDSGFSKAYRTRLREIPNSYSAFVLFIVLKDNTFPYINHTCYCQTDYGKVWQHAELPDEGWPHGFMYMTPPDRNQGHWAKRLTINCIMPFEEVRQWDATSIGRRGDSYLAWKKARTEQVLDKMERLHPGFRNMVESVSAASPLTVRDYYHTKDGALYGYRKDCRDIALSQLPVYTKVGNLLLTGQNVNLHGICGVPLTAVMTAEAIVGRNRIIENINQNYNNHGDY